MYFPAPGYENEDAWYERYPLDKPAVSAGLRVFPRDTIQTTLTRQPGSGEVWRMQVKETATGAVWTHAVIFISPVSGPVFVVEDPGEEHGDLAPFPRWGSVTFTHMEIRVGGTWRPAGEFAGLRINMIRNGKTLATAGALRGGASFTASQAGCSPQAVLC